MKTLFNNRAIAWAAFALIVALYVNTVIQNSINVPFSDDFHQQLVTASTLEAGYPKADSLFRQHNVHRIFTTHGFTYLEHAISGEVNLNHQLYFALAMLLALTLVLISFSQKKGQPIMILMVGIFLLSPEAGSTWVGGTTPYYALMLFGLISIKTLFLIDRYRYLLISLACLWLTMYSMIGGVILPVVGIVYLALTGNIKKVSGVLWAVGSIAILAWYFKDFKSHGNQPSIFYFLEDLQYAFDFTLSVLGNFFNGVIERDFLSMFTLVMLCGFIYLVFAKTSLKEFYVSPEGLAFVFTLVVIGSVVAGRLGFNEPDIAYSDRYFTYTKSLWLLALTFLINNQLVKREAKSFILGFSALYLLAAYKYETTNLEAYKQRQGTAMFNHLVRGDSSGFKFGSTREAGRIVNRAIALGVYSPELLVTKSRSVKYLKYSEFKDGLGATIVQDLTVGNYRYLSFSVDADTEIHEVVIVPREVHGPATILKPAAKVDYPLSKDVTPFSDALPVYEVIIDTSKYDDSLTNDVFLISLGMITTLGTL